MTIKKRDGYTRVLASWRPGVLASWRPGVLASWFRGAKVCAPAVMMLALAACTNPELSALNIAHDSPGPIDDPAMLASGQLVLDDSKLGPMRDALTSVNFSGKIDFHPTTPCADDEPDTTNEDESERPCLTINYDGSATLLPALVNFPLGLPSGFIPRMPLAIPSAVVTMLDALYAGPANTPYTFDVEIDPSQVHVSRQFGLGDTGNGQIDITTDETGLWFPLTIELPTQFRKEFLCDCADPTGDPGYGAYPLPDIPQMMTCEDLCTTADFSTWDGLDGWAEVLVPIVGNCDVFDLFVRANRVRLWLGLIPDAGPATNSGVWTKDFGTGKDFHLDRMFGLRAVVAGMPVVTAVSDQLPNVADGNAAFSIVQGDSTSDAAIAVDVQGCSAIAGAACDLADCDQFIAQTIANNLGNSVYSEFTRNLQTDLDTNNIASFDPPSFPSGSVPCNLLSTCAEGQIREFAAASITYQVFDWFYGAFGPYPNGASLTVSDVVKSSPSGWLDLMAAMSGLPVPSTVTFQFNADRDGDGIFDGDDNCVDRKNSDQTDTDGDGHGDACDFCKCDPNNIDDVDGDGICEVECAGPGDNCPTIANRNQQNCNLVSERVHSPTAILGDACDPVPCPDERGGGEFVHTHFESPPSGWMVKSCGYRVNDTLDVHPIQSYATTAGLPPKWVDGVTTDARFCIKNSAAGTECDGGLNYVRDDLAFDTDCAEIPGVSSCARPENYLTKYHRMSFTQGGNGADPNGTASVLDYRRTYTDPNEQTIWVWDYASDYDRWVATSSMSQLMLGISSEGELQGTRWLHARTAVGDTVDVGTGLHGEQLANHHRLDLQTHEEECHTNKAEPLLVQFPFFLWRTLPDPPDYYRRWDSGIYETNIVGRAGTSDWGVLDHDGYTERITDRMSPTTVALLEDTSVTWANMVEPVISQADQARVPMAVALAFGGADVVDGILSDGQSLSLVSDTAPLGSASGAAPNATGFSPVLTSAGGGLFIVGGHEVQTNTPTNTIHFYSFERNAPGWDRLELDGYAPSEVLSATYSFASNRLYVLDRLSYRVGDQARLVAVDPRTGQVDLLGQWAWTWNWYQQSLLVDTDGSLLLASSNGQTGMHRVTRIDLSAAPGAVSTYEGVGDLTYPPVVDAGGYTVVTHDVQNYSNILVDRLAQLPLVTSSLSVLGDQL